MQPVKLGGLTLKSEEKKEGVITFSGEDTPGPSLKDREEDAIIEDNDPAFTDAAPEGILDGLKDEDETPEHEPTLMEELRLIIKRVEEWPRDDNTIKAIGKLKGALQLLS